MMCVHSKPLPWLPPLPVSDAQQWVSARACGCPGQRALLVLRCPGRGAVADLSARAQGFAREGPTPFFLHRRTGGIGKKPWPGPACAARKPLGSPALKTCWQRCPGCCLGGEAADLQHGPALELLVGLQTAEQHQPPPRARCPACTLPGQQQRQPLPAPSLLDTSCVSCRDLCGSLWGRQRPPLHLPAETVAQAGQGGGPDGRHLLPQAATAERVVGPSAGYRAGPGGGGAWLSGPTQLGACHCQGPGACCGMALSCTVPSGSAPRSAPLRGTGMAGHAPRAGCPPPRGRAWREAGGFRGARGAQKLLYSQEHFYSPGCSVLVLPRLGRGTAHAPLCGMCCVTWVRTWPFS